MSLRTVIKTALDGSQAPKYSVTSHPANSLCAKVCRCYLCPASLFLCLLLCGRLGLCSLLPVAADHDDTEERSNNCGADEEEDNGYANGPDSWGKETLEWVDVVDKGLYWSVICGQEKGGVYQRNDSHHDQCPDSVVEEYDGGSHEHGETD